MTLGEKQRLFNRLQTEFCAWMYAEMPGYEFTDGDAYRDHRVHGAPGEKKAYGAPNSKHKQRLARDYNLFINGVYQETTEAHRPLGEKWESMHPLCRWGGNFRRPDGNHYEFRSDR